MLLWPVPVAMPISVSSPRGAGAREHRASYCRGASERSSRSRHVRVLLSSSTCPSAGCVPGDRSSTRAPLADGRRDGESVKAGQTLSPRGGDVRLDGLRRAGAAGRCRGAARARCRSARRPPTMMIAVSLDSGARGIPAPACQTRSATSVSAKRSKNRDRDASERDRRSAAAELSRAPSSVVREAIQDPRPPGPHEPSTLHTGHSTANSSPGPILAVSPYPRDWPVAGLF